MIVANLPASLNGLVLAGGKSRRMGRDKGLMRYGHKPQRYYLADLLGQFCDQVYISCRREQEKAIADAGYQPLVDDGMAEKQYGAILSALNRYPDRAWLVVACDLPMINPEAMNYLIGKRDSSMIATAYKNPRGGLPEPLLAIWEPRSRDMLIEKLGQGITCPRKALIGSSPDVVLADPPNSLILMNANTPEDAGEARKLISSMGAAKHA